MSVGVVNVGNTQGPRPSARRRFAWAPCPSDAHFSPVPLVFPPCGRSLARARRKFQAFRQDSVRHSCRGERLMVHQHLLDCLVQRHRAVLQRVPLLSAGKSSSTHFRREVTDQIERNPKWDEGNGAWNTNSRYISGRRS